MPPHLFWLKYFSQLPIYFMILACSITLHWLIFKKHFMGVMDPLFLCVFGFVFNLSTLFFVFYVTEGAVSTLIELFTMQMFLYLGFIMLAPNTDKIKQMCFDTPHKLQHPELDLGFIILGMGTFLFIISTLLEYVTAGIPLFKVSRLGVFTGSGLGIIARFEDIGFIFMSLLVARLIVLRDKCSTNLKFICVILLIVLIFLSVLSGSKGALIGFASIVYLFYSANYMNKHNIFPKLLTMKNVIIISFLAFSALVAIYVNPASGSVFSDLTSSKLMLTFYGFFYRLINYGDIYIFALVDNTIDALPASGGLASLFSGVLATFRIILPEDIPVHLGYGLAMETIPGMDYVSGPNANFNVFGLHYFGVAFGMLFSFLIGLFMGWFRRILLTSVIAILRNDNDIKSFFNFILGLIGVGIAVDPIYFSSRFTSLIIVFLIVCILSFPVFLCVKETPLPKVI